MTFRTQMIQGYCVCPLSWSVHCNFTGDGKCNERGWASTPHPYQPGLILPSWWTVRQKAAVATLCTLWLGPMKRKYHLRNYNKSLYVSGLWIHVTHYHCHILRSAQAFKRFELGSKLQWSLKGKTVSQGWERAKGTCAAEAIFCCPTMNSHRPKS